MPLNSGGTASCTLKQPTLKLRRQVRALVIRETGVNQERSSMNQQLASINAQIGQLSIKVGAATLDLDRIQPGSDIADAIKLVEASETELAAAVQARDAIVLAMDDRDEVACDLNIQQAALVINVPNAKDGTPRSFDDVATDDVDPDELSQALVFFLRGKQS